MSDNSAATDGIPTKQSRAAMAARYAAVIFGAIAGSAVLKLLLHRILAMPRNEQLQGPFILGFVLGIIWFALAFLRLPRASSSDDAPRQSQPPTPNRTTTALKTISRALFISGVLAIVAWTGLALNDDILESRSLPWIAPLITVQECGFEKASHEFPCQIEGSDIGCEAYKWLPAFLGFNTLCYFPLVLIISYFLQRSEAARHAMQAAAHLFARWSAVAVGAGLVALQVMHALNLDTHDSLYPHPGIAHWHFGAWEQLSDITGTLITIAGLSLPFYFYRVIRRGQGLNEVRLTLAEATSLSATMLVALILGNVY